MHFSLSFYSIDVPGPPGIPDISKVTENAMTLNWEPPKSDGGSRVTGYQIEKKESMSTRWIRVTTDTVSDTTFRVTRLNEGADYEFRVSAVNKAGVGPPSGSSEKRKAKAPYGMNKFSSDLICPIQS